MSDWIAALALVTAISSAVIALYALRETKRATEVALLARREIIYDAFKVLATEALCQGESLKAEQVQTFELHADSATKYLPQDIAEEVGTFFANCQTLVWFQTLSQPIDETYVLRAKRAAAEVDNNALRIEEKLLALIHRATAH